MRNTASFLLLHFLKSRSLLFHYFNKQFLLALFALFTAQIAEAQHPELDSLRRKLTNAKDDTSKVLIMAKMEDIFGFYNYDSAIVYARKALELAQSLRYVYGQTITYRNLFFAYNVQGEYPKTLEAMVEALKWAEKLSSRRDSTMADIHAVTGFVYREMDDLKDAIGQESQAVSLAGKAGMRMGSITHWQWELANDYLIEKKPDSARFWADKVTRTMNESKSPILTTGIGRYYEKLGDLPLAEKYYRQIIKNKQSSLNHDNDYFLTGFYIDLASVLYKMKNADSSISYSTKAIEIGQRNRFLHYALNAAKLLAQAYENKGKADSVVKYLKLAMATNESIFTQSRLRQFQTLGFLEEQRQKEIQLAAERYRNQVRSYGLIAALAVFLAIAFILYRNNRQKQKANTLLHNQKLEIESALSTLKTTQKQLIQSEKMASLGELTAGIAHEIQNPLNFVNNFSEVNKELTDELRQKLNSLDIDSASRNEIVALMQDVQRNEEKIGHHGKRADAIVKGMLQHARTGTGQKEPTDINATAEEWLRLSYYGIRSKDPQDAGHKLFNANIKTNFDPSIGEILNVPQDLGRVFLNLFNNSFYSMQEKKLKLDGEYEPEISVSTRKIVDKVEIRVRDNGQGIPQKIIDKIFHPFFTTKPPGQGTGLGLSLTYDIITKEHGGNIIVETKEGEYAEFIIILPLS